MKRMLVSLFVMHMGFISAIEQATETTIRLTDKQAIAVQEVLTLHEIQGDNMKRGEKGREKERIRRATNVLKAVKEFSPEQALDSVTFTYSGSVSKMLTMGKSLTVTCKKHGEEHLFVTMSQSSKFAHDILYYGVISRAALEKRTVRFTLPKK